ncbi:hypothetical protein FE257_004820 [Aspergillus nanangensis]|uniref:Uncharacterized protein n=1 Tax=Aspergillus nanangensis TaxID=2582783 RepID=A0AAD4CR82_ASPNN|nr:hypothetical protein FE257_004820 [Aspergillus nanangensis]
MSSAIFHRSPSKNYDLATGGDGVYLVHADGSKTLDGSSGAAVSCLGHGHPVVIDAIVQQAQKLAFAHTSFFTNSPAEELAQFLISHSSEAFTKTMFLTSGSEAVESAIKLARQFHISNGEPQRTHFLCRQFAYHGNTLGALSAGFNPPRREPFAPLLSPAFHHVSPCFFTRDAHPNETEETYVDRLIHEYEAQFLQLGPTSVAAILIEPVSGATLGAVPAAQGYLSRLRQLCDKYGALLIFDEVMCGMGRVGTLHAWQALDDGQIAPDLQTIGKGLGGGYQPISAVLIGAKVERVLVAAQTQHPFVNGHTYQGHAIGCAAALATQTVIAEGGLLGNVQAMGRVLEEKLRQRTPWLKEVRGLGLFRAVEFQTQAGNRIAADVAAACLANGAAVYLCSPAVDAVLFAPPFIISEAQVEELVDIFHNCLPIPKAFNKDPFFGLDTIPASIRARRQHRLLDRNCSAFRLCGNTFTVRELHRHAIVTIEPDNIKTVLSLNFHDYGISHRQTPFEPLLGRGIFDTDGEHWAASRALIRPSFTREQVADLEGLEGLMQDLLRLLPSGHGDGEETVDLSELFFRYTIDSATEFLFGRSVGTLKKNEQETAFADAFHYAQADVLRRGMLGSFLTRLFPDPKADECNRVCREFVQGFVDEAFQAVEGEKKESVYPKRQQQQQEQQHFETKSKRIFSHELASRTSDRTRVLDELMNVLLAGRDTTASVLSNLFFMLARDAAIWNKLRQEVAVLQGRPPTYDELNGLRYVKCCVNESLRLHPAVPRNDREALRDTVLPLGGGADGLSPVFVPKGTLVAYNLYAMHRRTDIYGPDAEDFRPERWEDGTLQPRWGYLPFNGGPRICIGQRYALTEISYVLVRMVQEFAGLESRDPEPWREKLSLTLCPLNGTKVRLIR